MEQTKKEEKKAYEKYFKIKNKKAYIESFQITAVVKVNNAQGLRKAIRKAQKSIKSIYPKKVINRLTL